MSGPGTTFQGVYKGVHVHPQGGHPPDENPQKSVKTTTSRTRREAYTGEGGVHVHPCTPLADWLDTLRHRGISAGVDNGHVTLHGPATHLDQAWLQRHHDALAIGAAGTHPDWWNAITSGDPTDLDPADTPDVCMVDGCPGPLELYSPDGIPYCADHHPDWWHAPLPAVTR